MPKRAAHRPAPIPKPAPAVRVTKRRSIAGRMLLAFSGLATGSILALGITAFLIAHSLLSSRILTQVASMAAVREDVLEEAVRGERERTSLVAARAEIQALTTAEDPSAGIAALHAELRRQRLPVLGVTLLGRDRKVRAGMGQISPSPVGDVPTSTLSPLIDRKAGWIANDVYVPLSGKDGLRSGYLAVRYDAAPIVDSLFSASSLDDATVMLGAERGGEVSVLYRSGDEPLRAYRLGSVDDPFLSGVPLTRAVQAEEGASRARDERGAPVFAAYRFVPSLGWGMAVEVPVRSALGGAVFLGGSLGLVGALLLLLSIFVASVASRAIVSPLTELTGKMAGLRPGSWLFTRTVHTGDEVEVMDAAFADLAGRLREAYGRLEDTVAERTDELRKESTLDRAILETIEYGVVTTDAHGKVTDMNPAALKLLQWKKDDVLGKPGADVLTFAQRRRTMVGDKHPLSEVLRTRDAYRSRAAEHPSLLRKDQTLLPVSLIATPLLQGKKLIGAIVVFQDMTEDRQVDYLKSEFISLASHQLRTPLSSIRWYVEMLSQEGKKDLSSSQKAYFGEIERASKRMANLLEALLHVAKLEGGGMTPEPQNINLHELSTLIAQEWTPAAKEKGVTFTVALPSAHTTVRTDPVLLQIIIQNFLNNAFKYTPRGKEVTLRFRKEGARVILSVQDQGVGIPTVEQRRVFEKFFRAHNVRHMDTDGTGLGLYMSRAIAEKLGGSIFFESEETRGSTFTLVLPAHPGHAHTHAAHTKTVE